MKSKSFTTMTVVLFLASTFNLTSSIQPVEAELGAIYIRADGRIDPPTANISSADNVTYTFIGKLADEIVIERDNIVVDGAGYTLRGKGWPAGQTGIEIHGRSNVTIRNMTIELYRYGIWLDDSSNITVSGNDITNCHNGIGLSGSSSNNTFYHNSFKFNDLHVDVWPGYNNSNTWDDDYPSGGNYWGGGELQRPSYGGNDSYSGLCQNETGSDGIGDTLYSIEYMTGHPMANNRDRYPLMKPWSSFPIKAFDVVVGAIHYSVTTLSNSSVTHFIFNQTLAQINFKLAGESETAGYCNVMIPNNLLWGGFFVFMDGSLLVKDVGYTQTDNATHYTLHFAYNHSTKIVEIIGAEVVLEFPTLVSIFLTLIVLTVAATVYKRRLLKTPMRLHKNPASEVNH